MNPSPLWFYVENIRRWSGLTSWHVMRVHHSKLARPTAAPPLTGWPLNVDRSKLTAKHQRNIRPKEF